jgi:hypothetical protein
MLLLTSGLKIRVDGSPGNTSDAESMKDNNYSKLKTNSVLAKFWTWDHSAFVSYWTDDLATQQKSKLETIYFNGREYIHTNKGHDHILKSDRRHITTVQSSTHMRASSASFLTC